jgi:hypothetical protein
MARMIREGMYSFTAGPDLAQAWQSDGAGLVINERLLNCPPQLASPLHHGLFDEEVPWATEDEATQALRNSFKFKSYLFMSRIYRDTLQEEAHQAASQQAAKSRKRRKVGHLRNIAASRPSQSPRPLPTWQETHSWSNTGVPWHTHIS